MKPAHIRPPRRRRYVTSLAGAALALALASHARRGDAAAPGGDAGVGRATSDTVSSPTHARLWIEMANVDLHVDEANVLEVRRLRGEVLPRQGPAKLDDPASFTVRVTSGTVALGGPALSAILNEIVFHYHGAPLSHLEVTMRDGRVVQRGIMHKGVDLPFEITADVSLMPDGRVRLRPVRTRILGINGAALMKALGLHLDRLLDLSGAHGIAVKGNDLFLEPTAILPPPAIAGRLTSIRVEGDRLVQDFARLPDDSVFDRWAHVPDGAPNHVYFRGGQLQFGRLLMSDTDLEIVDRDPRDPFDLDLPEYNRQLVAGTSQTLATLGLRVVMPDYRIVARAGAPAAAGAVGR